MTMKTVADLLLALADVDPTLIVAVASDEEGNRILPWSDLSYAAFDKNEYRGDQFSGYLYDDDENETLVTTETATALVIWP